MEGRQTRGVLFADRLSQDKKVADKTVDKPTVTEYTN